MAQSQDRVEGLTELRAAFSRAQARMSAKQLSKELGRIMKPVRPLAQQLAPFDPKPDAVPHIRASIFRRRRIGSGRTATLAEATVGIRKSSGARASGFRQEFGTTRHRAQPFLQPALEQETPRMKAELADYLRRAFR